jgi:FtsP/CotA-like multicopper oxidase with cupredoxin domain
MTMCSIRSELGKYALIVSVIGAAIMPGVGAQAAELTFALRIENARVPANMRLIRVKQGDVVKLEWSADRRAVVHLHGYDIEKEIAPGTVTDLTFTANATGRFPIHLHAAKEGSGGHGHEEALVDIEVYPR